MSSNPHLFEIPVAPPFSLHFTVRVLQRLPSNRIDRWEAGIYGRLLPIGERLELVTVTQSGGPQQPAVQACARLAPGEIPAVRRTIQQLLGATIELEPFYELVRRNGPLESLALALAGLKPPRYLSLFEALINAICCQQVSLTVGVLMMNRVSKLAGSYQVIQNEKYFAFPGPEQVSRLKPQQLRGLGLSNAKAAAMAALSEGFATGRHRQEEFEQLPTARAIEKLQSLPGVGAWSARYGLLRGLGRLDVFPTGDVGAARTLGELLGRSPMTPEEAERFARHWKQYAGLLYFHLLGNRYLAEQQERLVLSRVPIPLPLA